MMKRVLGTTGLEIAPVVLGGNVFGWTADRDASVAVLDAFVDEGGTMIDTADVYSAWVPGNSGGESEAMIGEWLKARGGRSDVQIASKVGWPMGGERGGLTPDRIMAAIDASLRRLGTDYVDLYYAHCDDLDTPQDEVAATFDRLVKAGKVRAIAASNFTPERLASALAAQEAGGFARYGAVQPLYNLIDRQVYEGPLQALALQQGLGVLTFAGLANGFLTGKYRSTADLEGRARGYRMGHYLQSGGLDMLARMDAVAAETGLKHAQIAITWLVTRPGMTAPIASATSPAQVREIMGAARVTLTDTQLAMLNA
jgi:aryl-alcohol dehydrogenase-like predicted oxidoreductase